MAQYFTDWSDYALDQAPAGWTDQFSVENIKTVIANPFGAGRTLELEDTTSSFKRSLFTLDAVDNDPDRANFEIVVKYRLPSISSRLWLGGRLSGSIGNETLYVGADRRIGSQLEVMQYLDGSFTRQGLKELVNPINTDLWLRFRVFGDQLKLRSWEDGSPEPTSAWDIETTNTQIAGAGPVGFEIIVENEGTGLLSYVHQIGIATGGESAPTAAPTGGTDNLTANDISSTSQVSAPSIAQAHDLASTDVSSTSAVTSPSIGQAHNLTSADVQATSQVSSPSLSSASTTDSLTANDISSASSVTSPALGQVHNIAANDAASTSETGAPALTQEHALTSVSLDSLSTVSSPSLTSIAGQTGLSANDVEATSTASSPTLGQIHALQPATVESASETSQPAIGQVHTLTANDLASTSSVSTPTIRDASQTLATPIKNTKAIAVTTTYKAAIIQTDYKAEVA